MSWVKRGLVFFLRPHQELLVDDGVRAGVEWEEVIRIDGMVKLLLEQFDVPYIPVASLSMQERVRLVERVLQLAGLPSSNDVRSITPASAAATTFADVAKAVKQSHAASAHSVAGMLTPNPTPANQNLSQDPTRQGPHSGSR